MADKYTIYPNEDYDNFSISKIVLKKWAWENREIYVWFKN